MGIIAESNEQREKRIQRRLNTCVHHNGYFHKVCDAGVLYESVGEQIDLGNLGRPFVAACIKNYEWNGQALECQHICALSQFPTRQQVEEDLERQEAALAEHLSKLAQSICPTHNIAITKKQVGRCVYAVECGCRLYQGKA
jgi:hypothetical protein